MALVMLVLCFLIGWRLLKVQKKAHFRYTGIVMMSWLILALVFQIYPVRNLLLFYFTGDAYVYEQPAAWMIYLFWGGLALSAQLIGWILMLDFVRLISTLSDRYDKFTLNRWHVFALGVAFIVITGYTVVKIYFDTTAIRLEERTIKVEELPESLEGFHITHISDLQADRFTGTKKMARYVAKINAQQPDLVLFSGDLVSWGERYIEDGASSLSEIEAPYGTFAVLGDHDYWAGSDTVISALRKHGIPVLDNQNSLVDLGEGKGTIKITGITQVYDRRVNTTDFLQLLEMDEPSDIQVLLSHQINERLIGQLEAKKYELALAGHTHGGQFAPALLFWPLSAPMMETDYVSGFYRNGDLMVNINNGLGFTLAPVRLHARAEVSVIRLEQRK